MEISSLLRVGPGVTAIIGGGGKTTLMYTLAEELRSRGTVLICTTTHIRRPPQYEVAKDADRLGEALRRWGVVCAGTPAEDGKLTAPAADFETLASLADYVLAEADGSRGLPMKAHGDREPVIPPNAARTILVIGADGFGRPIREVCHRPERFAALAGADLDAAVTPALCARVIEAEGFGDGIYLNKTESAPAWAAARELADWIGLPLTAGSLHRGEYQCLR